MKFTVACSILFLLFTACIQRKESPSLERIYSLYDQEKYEEALQQINILIAAHNDSALFYNLRGSIQKMMGNMDEALINFDKAVALQPTDHFYYSTRANYFYDLQKPDECIRDLNRAIVYAPEDSAKYNNIVRRGTAKAMKRDFQGAYEDFMVGMAFDSTNIAVLTATGTVLNDLNRREEAISYLEKAVRQAPREIAAIGNLGFTHMEAGNYEKAISLFNRVLEIAPEDPFAFNNRGFAHYKLHDLESAMKDIQRSIELKADNSYAFRNRALVYIAKKDMDSACRDLQHAIDLGFSLMYGDEVEQLKGQYCEEK